MQKTITVTKCYQQRTITLAHRNNKISPSKGPRYIITFLAAVGEFISDINHTRGARDYHVRQLAQTQVTKCRPTLLTPPPSDLQELTPFYSKKEQSLINITVVVSSLQITKMVVLYINLRNT